MIQRKNGTPRFRVVIQPAPEYIGGARYTVWVQDRNGVRLGQDYYFTLGGARRDSKRPPLTDATREQIRKSAHRGVMSQAMSLVPALGSQEAYNRLLDSIADAILAEYAPGVRTLESRAN